MPRTTQRLTPTLALPALAAGLLVLGGAAGGAPAVGAGAEPSRLCSIWLLSEVRSGVYLLVDGLADSVRVEARSTPAFEWRGGEPLPEGTVVRGQRVRFVEGIGVDERVSRLMAERGAVVVPWGYDAGCEPLVWTRSPILLEPGTRGLVRVTARPDSAWIGGVPTFDLRDPNHWPHPRPSARYPGPDDVAPPTAELLLELVRLLPTRDEARARGTAAFDPVLEWADANPELARWWPVERVLRQIRSGRIEPSRRF